MNEMFSVYLDFTPDNKHIEEVIDHMDQVIEANGWKYAGFSNVYLPIDQNTKDETIETTEHALKSTTWLKPYNPKIMVGHLTNAFELEAIDVSGMTMPSESKMRRYEEYYNQTGLLPHPIIVDENGKLRDGYISYLLAKKYNAKVDIMSSRSNLPVKKIVTGSHVAWDGENYSAKARKFYSWIYDLKKAVLPGDILLVHTRKGLRYMRVARIDYVTGVRACSGHRKVKRNETVYI